MKKLINILIISFIIISTVINLYFIYNLDRFVNERLEVLDVEPELIIVDSVKFDSVYTEKKEIVKLPIYNTDTIKQTDTIIHQDSIFVEIPISVKHYKDTLAETAISFDLRGFQCEMNNLYVENLKTPIIEENKPKRWGLGLQLGMGVTKEKISPYIGVGISYNLFNF